MIKIPHFPEDWNLERFENLYLIPSRNGLNRARHTRGCGFKMVNMKEIFAYSQISNPPMELVPMSATEILQFSLKEGDLLFARQSLVTEGAGKCSIVRSVPEITTFESHIIRIRLNENIANPWFYFYFLQSPVGVRKIRALVMQVAAAGIRGSELAKIIVPLPPLDEQRRIAEILSTWDDAIDAMTRLIAAKKRRKKALMQQLLTGKRRFPGFDGAWREIRLGEFLIQTSRKVKKPNTSYGALGILSHGKGTFTREISDPQKIMMTHLYEVKSEDLIVSITFAWEGAIALAKPTDEGRLVSHRFPTYTFNRKICSPHFFKYLMLSKRFFYKLKLISPGGAGRNRVMNKKDFLNLIVPLPPLAEQRRIAAVLQTADAELDALARKLSALKRQKKGLMQQLLTGKVRVSI